MLRRPGSRALEVAVYIAAAATVAGFLIARLVTVAGIAERTVVEATVANLQAALHVEYARLVLSARSAETAQWNGANPFRLTGTTAKTYLGEFDRMRPGDHESGHWLFDRGAGEVVYLVRWTGGFSTSGPLPNAIRFRLEVGQPPGERPVAAPVFLRPAHPYRWEP